MDRGGTGREGVSLPGAGSVPSESILDIGDALQEEDLPPGTPISTPATHTLNL